jgi:hypothetical protein
MNKDTRGAMKTTKKVFVLLGLLMVSLILAYLVGGCLRRNDWKKRTSPLSKDTVAVLCANFDLATDHPLCTGKKEVYGPDFYRIIRDTFRPYEAYEIESSEAATYDEVEEKIGVFKYECEPAVHQADGFTYFNCVYDLRGDREFIMGIMYTYPDMAVFRINTPMGYDGE